jgi:hypothetical protein
MRYVVGVSVCELMVDSALRERVGEVEWEGLED